MHIYIYIYIYICVYICIYIYMFIYLLIYLRRHGSGNLRFSCKPDNVTRRAPVVQAVANIEELQKVEAESRRPNSGVLSY